jgi:hypothetical protein
LTEVHLGGDPADEVLWWAEAWHDATSATRAGIPVEGVTTWAAFGSCGWDALLRFDCATYMPGCYDARSGEPVLTPLGEAVMATASGQPPAPLATGWWRQPYRLSFPGNPDVAA